ncbi:3263_t:CDS:2, partial [Funneliformis geosporum]
GHADDHISSKAGIKRGWNLNRGYTVNCTETKLVITSLYEDKLKLQVYMY